MHACPRHTHPTATYASPHHTPLPHMPPLPVVRRNNTRLWKHYLPTITVLGGNDKKGHNIVNDKTYWFKRIFAWFVSYEWHCHDKRSQLWMTHRDAPDDSPGLPNSHQDKIPSVFLVFLAFPGVFIHKNILVCKWPLPPLQSSFPPRYYNVKMTLR